MNPIQLETSVFLRISVELTGFDEMELLGTGMVEPYFNVILNQNSVAIVEAFLETARSILDGKYSPEKRKEAIASQLMPASLFAGLAQNIITMWYMGSWMNEMVSPTAYTQGLVWTAAGTHPPGARQPGYASWAKPPATTAASVGKKTQPATTTAAAGKKKTLKPVNS